MKLKPIKNYIKESNKNEKSSIRTNFQRND